MRRMPQLYNKFIEICLKLSKKGFKILDLSSNYTMKHKYLLLISLLLCIFTEIRGQNWNNAVNDQLRKLGLDATKERESNYTSNLINAWNTLNYEESKFNNYIALPAETWEYLLELNYKKININENIALKMDIGVALTTVLIDLSKYEKVATYIDELYTNRSVLDPNKLTLLLNNIESFYKYKNNISKAILIRNELVEKQLKKTYWQIYKACGLAEAALNDYQLFEEKSFYKGKQKIIKPYYYNNLSRLYFLNNQIDSAVKYAEIGLLNVEAAMLDTSIQFLYKEDILMNWKALYIGFLGKCDMNQKKDLLAIKKLKFAIENGKIDIESKYLNIIYLSLCYLNIGDNIKSKYYADLVKKSIDKIDAEDVKRSYYSLLNQYYAKIKQYDSAYFYIQLYSKFREKMHAGIRKDQSIMLLGQLEIQKRRQELYNKNISLDKAEIENKETKNRILNLLLLITAIFAIILFLSFYLYQNVKNKKILAIKNYVLNKSMKATNEQIIKNDLLLKELHHRVKNNLQVIYSLLNIEKRKLNELGSISSITSIQNRIQTMALVHQNLYTSDNYEMVHFDSYIKTLVNHLKSIYQVNLSFIEIKFDIDMSISLPIDKVISIGLIVNEAISNSLKYAFTDLKNGKLNIKIIQSDQLYTMTISDNGPGFDQNKVNTENIGMKLIHAMSDQLQGKYSLIQNNGVLHKLEFTING